MPGETVTETVSNGVDFCTNTANIWQLVGIILFVFKIVIPLLLIILGMVDLGKAVVSSDDKAITKAAKSLAFRIVAAVAIFFIPTIVSFIFGIVAAFSDVESDYNICRVCITSPFKEKEGVNCKELAGKL